MNRFARKPLARVIAQLYSDIESSRLASPAEGGLWYPYYVPKVMPPRFIAASAEPLGAPFGPVLGSSEPLKVFTDPLIQSRPETLLVK